ncbi:hypothetical protein DBR37_12200 [Herminiimonas sp. KBW02]|uniref:MAE_28990/MAE_18760 family HEPN-like nuclease n=1 Tax=Herminiimonas sp. KBW02 TaxID=2153363 RepID=UPI000F5B4782|nr:MAE_28990/MAE_18760 family HEPN-like nuclease [Herminiimonas sp. KBW02]RQO33889.1 hypothetical protein DBR37_12200 [Herminiimonas sp. KBW02]
MTFSIQRSSGDARFQEVRALLSFIKTQESDTTPPLDSELVKTLRGLFFVHLYGAFEKTISEAIEYFLQEVGTLSICYSHATVKFLPTAMHSNFQSLEAGEGKRWGKRLEFVRQLEANTSCAISNTIFSAQLQNVRPEVLSDIAACLGVQGPIQSTQANLLYLTEVVEKRNQVAHGRNTPASVGSSGRSNNLEINLNAVILIAHEFFELLEYHFNQLEFIDVANRSNYRPQAASQTI